MKDISASNPKHEVKEGEIGASAGVYRFSVFFS